ncbi:hypothetical protein PPSIR1_02531 [Plesiocystis pacifica SIR-1]|uniref:Cytokinin riboside 5'-monophosphate phosphoribohydrolase n=1 Tax=Plesiocystis pacifica SIR-1 TaxID=391625 RepID=A6G470_9BACT|nr:TIGR00730 family Rossman fold protein [Plesiocystis pacifica]EDM79393.1 hypothetical protein PPSIR1_02531 [Plesiocystis pacifica SIR-1]
MGARPEYVAAARAMGEALAARGLSLVYGGGHVGLMGVVADAALERGAEVVGVIPEFLEAREVGHRGLTQLHVVSGMHPRKAQMAALGDAFVALPGGMGTLEELFEMLTWAQVGLHQKPIGLLDVGGYWQPLVAMVEHMIAEGFVAPEHRALLRVEAEVDALLDRLVPGAA